MSRIRASGLATLALVLAASACGDAPPAPATHAHDGVALATSNLTPQHRRQLATLKKYLAPFHSFDRAVAAGYSTAITGCMEQPGVGGMGFHYGNVALIDGVADREAPEVLLYEPRPEGGMRLVGIEYIVPLAASATPPVLYGQEFHRNERFQVWALHVWLFKHNPNGLFADWNPRVSC